ncbi:MAG: hypothetical protein ACOYW3_10615, partial [Bacteroidota bacterium]
QMSVRVIVKNRKYPKEGIYNYWGSRYLHTSQRSRFSRALPIERVFLLLAPREFLRFPWEAFPASTVKNSHGQIDSDCS